MQANGGRIISHRQNYDSFKPRKKGTRTHHQNFRKNRIVPECWVCKVVENLFPKKCLVSTHYRFNSHRFHFTPMLTPYGSLIIIITVSVYFNFFKLFNVENAENGRPQKWNCYKIRVTLPLRFWQHYKTSSGKVSSYHLLNLI